MGISILTVLRFVRNEFSEGQEPTIGASFLTSSVVCDDATIKMDIWDTAGQEYVDHA